MTSKLVSFGLFFILSIVYSAQSFAVTGNCNDVKDTTGKIVSVNLGWDDSSAENIAFNYKRVGYVSKRISVKRTIGDASGHAMYQLLLTAMLTQSEFKIVRCETDQLIGGEILNY
ncbi:hypothetical protein ACNSPD_10435 [Yersinia enterocolitica]|uniref:hypothetical protein n=1 Tax=Yersinia enterocolitica TaxID=630 RepID=UPI003AB710C9